MGSSLFLKGLLLVYCNSDFGGIGLDSSFHSIMRVTSHKTSERGKDMGIIRNQYGHRQLLHTVAGFILTRSYLKRVANKLSTKSVRRKKKAKKSWKAFISKFINLSLSRILEA